MGGRWSPPFKVSLLAVLTDNMKERVREKKQNQFDMRRISEMNKLLRNKEKPVQSVSCDFFLVLV